MCGFATPISRTAGQTGASGIVFQRLLIPGFREGLEPRTAPNAPWTTARPHYNPSSGKPLIHGSKWKAIQQSRIYLKMVRPWLPLDTRRWLSGKLLPKAPTALTPPTKTTVQYIVDQVYEDTLQLAKLTGSPKQWWDLNEVLEKYKKQ